MKKREKFLSDEAIKSLQIEGDEMDKKPADTCETCKWRSGKLCSKSKEIVSTKDWCFAYKKKKKEDER